MVDGFGHTIAMTTTIENVFGSPLMVRGFLLDNELTDSSNVPGEDAVPAANCVAGDKRPRSSMSPTLVFARASGRLMMGTGWRLGGHQLHRQRAGRHARLGPQGSAGDIAAQLRLAQRPTVLEEGRASTALIDTLKSRGHELTLMTQSCGPQGIQRTTKDGKPIGSATPTRITTVS